MFDKLTQAGFVNRENRYSNEKIRYFPVKFFSCVTKCSTILIWIKYEEESCRLQDSSKGIKETLRRNSFWMILQMKTKWLNLSIKLLINFGGVKLE